VFFKENVLHTLKIKENLGVGKRNYIEKKTSKTFSKIFLSEKKYLRVERETQVFFFF
jgi:hypothetical protein